MTTPLLILYYWTYYPTEKVLYIQYYLLFFNLKLFQVQINRWTQSKGFHFGDLKVFGVCRVGEGGKHRTILSLSVCSDSLKFRSKFSFQALLFSHIFFGETLIANHQLHISFHSQSSDSRVSRLLQLLRLKILEIVPSLLSALNHFLLRIFLFLLMVPHLLWSSKLLFFYPFLSSTSSQFYPSLNPFWSIL